MVKAYTKCIVQKDLKKELKISKTDTLTKVLALKEGIKKVASQLIEAKAEIKKIKSEADKKIKFYSENAKEIIKRKIALGENFGTDLSDEDILDNEKFAKAQLEKENTLLRAQVEGGDDSIADKSAVERDAEWYSNKQKQIDNIAFGRNESKN